MKIIFVHGNGGDTKDIHWKPETAKTLESLGYAVINETFPDNEEAHANIWLPYLKQLGADEDTIIVGHSSGALAAMRYAETHRIGGSVLIGACHTDLDDPVEKQSGFFDTPWNWDAIKANQPWIVQFASTDDPYIAVEEPRYIHKMLSTDYHEFTDKGHFMYDGVFTELVEVLRERVS